LSKTCTARHGASHAGGWQGGAPLSDDEKELARLLAGGSPNSRRPQEHCVRIVTATGVAAAPWRRAALASIALLAACRDCRLAHGRLAANLVLAAR
jgi:hypothetical protein